MKTPKIKEEVVIKQDEVVPHDTKLDSAIRILLEKLTQSGIKVEDKEIIIKNGKLTIN